MERLTAKKLINSTRRAIFPVLGYALLAFWSLILVLSFVWGILTSLKTGLDFYANPVGLPSKWEFKNYIKALDNIYADVGLSSGTPRRIGFFGMLVNTLLYAVGAPFFAVMTAACASYVACKYKQFRWTKILYGIVIFSSFMPIGASLAANLQLMNSLRLYDSMIGMWIFSSGAFGFMFLVYYAAFKSLSWEFAESAFIDGAGHFRVFTTIMIPLTRTTFGILFLTSFIGIWNDYMTPMIFLPSYPTIAYGAWIFQYSSETAVSSVSVKLAGLLIVCFPTFLLFVIFKDKLIGELTMGGLKG